VDSAYRPQLATLVTQPPRGDTWLHEIKFDGYRIGCRIENGRATLISRSGKDWTHRFPDIADAAVRLGVRDGLIDGEVAVVLPDGRTSFQHLQHAVAERTPAPGPRRPGGGSASLVYFVFDLLRLEGERLDALPLEERKARLRTLVRRRNGGRIRYVDHVEGQGETFFEQAGRLGLEGIVSKRRDLPYRGGRHDGWVKTKCIRRQSFVIGGFTDPAVTRAGLGALVIGCYEDDRLVFCGKVGTGFSHETALDLRRRLDRASLASSPFDPPPPGRLGRTAHWVAPTLVCEVAFTEWTGDGKIRHPSFQGLRTDKKPCNVVRERS
jgi:bifunctional non-homologous end joining protein LigD